MNACMEEQLYGVVSSGNSRDDLKATQSDNQADIRKLGKTV